MSDINCIKYHNKGILSGRNDGYIYLHDFFHNQKDFISFQYEKFCQSLTAFHINENKFVSSHDTDLLFWDIRNPKSYINLIKDASNDEIGAINISKSDEFISCGDDSGVLQIIDNEYEIVFSDQVHNNIITSTLFFNSKVLSAGMDSEIVVRHDIHDNNDPKYEKFNLSSLINDFDFEEENDNDVISECVSLAPPLINDMIVFNDFLFCGAENCSIEMFNLNEELDYENSFYNHSLGVSCLEKTKDLLISAGNDCKLSVWKMNIDNELEVIDSVTNDGKFNSLTFFTENSVCFSDVNNSIKVLSILDSRAVIIDLL